MLLLTALSACTPYLYTEEIEPGDASDWVAPENTWYSETPPVDLTSEGFSTGQVPPEFRVLDQYGDEVSLWQFYGQLILLDISTLWCAPCQEIAEDVEETAQHYANDEVTYITLMPQNLFYTVPSQSDLQYWADTYGITSPVLADDEEWSYNVVPEGSTEGFPALMLIGRDMRIIEAEILPKTDAEIRSVNDANL
jgi:thiol-disulfide isomerase/thioredoxin